MTSWSVAISVAGNDLYACVHHPGEALPAQSAGISDRAVHLQAGESQESRNAALLLAAAEGLYQPYGTTSADRYPDIFLAVRKLLEGDASVRILLFGCATGEEVFSLRRYFPEANIAGLDINPLNIAVCRFRRLKAGARR